jgi:hypothetical protein
MIFAPLPTAEVQSSPAPEMPRAAIAAPAEQEKKLKSWLRSDRKKRCVVES